MARYRSAVKLFFQREPVVADKSTDSAATESVVADNGAQSAVAEYQPFEINPFAKFRTKTVRKGMQYYSKLATFKRNSTRQRCHGGGRGKTCAIIGELLIEWYSIIRHSVDTNIMCRFPKQCLLVKAKMIQQDYYVCCMKQKVPVEHVKTDGKWLN